MKTSNKKKKKIIGLIEKVKIIGQKGEITSYALIDTGATRTSVDIGLAAKAGLGPVVDSVTVKGKSLLGKVRRPIVEGIIEIKGKKIKTKMSLEDRSNMATKVLVGRDVIHSNFIVDITKTHKDHKLKSWIKKIEKERGN
ncbi:MAG: ATP-dependent zinc protease [Candidatus Diapherotrites archaeon]|nr:ATP-dependent zinc protease [Candidatus Diapherotrites archaeon]